jgi:hypothetical protein
MLEPFSHVDYERNNELLEKFLKSLPSSVSCHKNKYERADVYYDIPIDDFKSFFITLYFSDNASNITPKQFNAYLTKWRELGKPIPAINIAVFGTDASGVPANRRRQILGSIKDFKSVEELKENASATRLAPFRGGKSDENAVKKNPDKSYCGDVFIDMPLVYHKDNYYKPNLRRDKSMPILVIFYKINSNYVGLFPSKTKPGSKPCYFEKNDLKYRDTQEPVITYSVAMPLGGPIYKTQKNKLATPAVLNTKICEDFFDKLYGNDGK